LLVEKGRSGDESPDRAAQHHAQKMTHFPLSSQYTQALVPSGQSGWTVPASALAAALNGVLSGLGPYDTNEKAPAIKLMVTRIFLSIVTLSIQMETREQVEISCSAERYHHKKWSGRSQSGN
jgi:hypothetical protein